MKQNGLPELTEHEIQALFFQQVELEFRLDDSFVPELLYAVLNGAWIASDGKGKAGLIEKYKAEGWKPGVPDVHYDQPRGDYNKMIFEFKRESRRNKKDGGLSDDQIVFITAATEYAFVRVVYSIDEAMAAFRNYMAMPAKGS